MENDLQERFNERGIYEQDLIFVEEMIVGPSHPQVSYCGYDVQQ